MQEVHQPDHVLAERHALAVPRRRRGSQHLASSRHVALQGGVDDPHHAGVGRGVGSGHGTHLQALSLERPCFGYKSVLTKTTRAATRVALTDVPDDTAATVGKLPIKMLHDRILVALRKEDGDRRSTGGILIPATAQVAKRLVWGEARGVGASVRQVKVGDQVLFSPEDQHEVEVHGEDLIILRERDVHAVAAERIEESTGLYL